MSCSLVEGRFSRVMPLELTHSDKITLDDLLVPGDSGPKRFRDDGHSILDPQGVAHRIGFHQSALLEPVGGRCHT